MPSQIGLLKCHTIELLAGCHGVGEQLGMEVLHSDFFLFFFLFWPKSATNNIPSIDELCEEIMNFMLSCDCSWFYQLIVQLISCHAAVLVTKEQLHSTTKCEVVQVPLWF